MEEKQKMGSSSSYSSASSFSSSSSLTSELFGYDKDPFYSSSSAIFGHYFPPPSKVSGEESLPSDSKGKTPKETQDEGETQNKKVTKDSSFYYDQRVYPCHLGSSIFYGGQDVDYRPQNTENAEFNSLASNKKGGGEDDTEIASRGNWWQGSLYY